MATVKEARESANELAHQTAVSSPAPDCVLLIEDNEEAMWLVKDALQRHGNGKYSLEWAKDLSEGLLYLSKNSVAVVLLDLGLPDSSGPSSSAAIRKVAPEVPVLVLTGDARPETEFEVTAGGTQDYLVKDEVSAPLLLQAINAALYQNRRDRQSSK